MSPGAVPCGREFPRELPAQPAVPWVGPRAHAAIDEDCRALAAHQVACVVDPPAVVFAMEAAGVARRVGSPIHRDAVSELRRDCPALQVRGAIGQRDDLERPHPQHLRHRVASLQGLYARRADYVRPAAG